jgi:amino acid transporter
MGTVAEEAVGPWLGGWVVFAAGIANLAMFLAEMSSDAFQILGLAERGYLPKIFSQRSRYGTPTYGILVGTCVILAMSVSNLSSLIELLNFNYAL